MSSGSREGGPTILFVHVMKTAGTSLLAAARTSFGVEAVEPRLRIERPGDFDEATYASIDRLRDLDAERRAGLRLVAGHVPLYVRAVVQPDITLTVLREPVARAVSLLRQVRRNRPRHAGSTLEAVYDDPWIGSTLVRNYQVKLFAMTEAEAEARVREVAERTGRPPVLPVDRADLLPYRMDDERLAVAIANLEQIEILGVQERFASLLQELRGQHGWQFDDEPWLRTAPDGDEPVPDALRERLEHELLWDRAFYQRAVELCDERGQRP